MYKFIFSFVLLIVCHQQSSSVPLRVSISFLDDKPALNFKNGQQELLVMATLVNNSPDSIVVGPFFADQIVSFTVRDNEKQIVTSAWHFLDAHPTDIIVIPPHDSIQRIQNVFFYGNILLRMSQKYYVQAYYDRTISSPFINSRLYNKTVKSNTLEFTP